MHPTLFIVSLFFYTCVVSTLAEHHVLAASRKQRQVEEDQGVELTDFVLYPPQSHAHQDQVEQTRVDYIKKPSPEDAIPFHHPLEQQQVEMESDQDIVLEDVVVFVQKQDSDAFTQDQVTHDEVDAAEMCVRKLNTLGKKVVKGVLWACPRAAAGLVGAGSAAVVVLTLSPVMTPVGAAVLGSMVSAVTGPAAGIAVGKLEKWIVAKVTTPTTKSNKPVLGKTRQTPTEQVDNEIDQGGFLPGRFMPRLAHH